MIDWFRKRFIREGKVIVTWPAKDLREDRLVVDLSKLDENLVGIRRRQYGVFHRMEPLPEYQDEVEFIPLNKLQSFSKYPKT